MATCGTAGDIMLANFSHYLLATKGGVKTAMSEHLRFDYDQKVFKSSISYDGSPAWNNTLTPYKDANDQSACVAVCCTGS